MADETPAIPRVAMLTGSLSPRAGGMFYSARIPANIMAEQGRSPHVLGLSDPDLAASRDRWHVETLSAFEPKGPGGFGAVPALRRALEAIRPDVLHARGIWLPTSLAAWRWRRRHGTPLVISTHGMLDPKALQLSAGKKRIIAAAFERANMQHASVMHALNRSEANAMRAYGLRTPIAIIPNGVDLMPLPEAGVSGRGPRRTMLFLARIHPKKGISELLHGWALFRAQRPDLAAEWRLDIAGWDDGGHLPHLEALARDLALAGNVAFVGPRYDREKIAVMDAADAFILPSFSEGLPISVLEAWERALPVLMTDACNLPEGFARGAALRIAPEPGDIARGIAKLAAMEPARRTAMGRAGRGLVAEQFGWEAISADYLALYDWLHHGGDAPACVEYST